MSHSGFNSDGGRPVRPVLVLTNAGGDRVKVCERGNPYETWISIEADVLVDNER